MAGGGVGGLLAVEAVALGVVAGADFVDAGEGVFLLLGALPLGEVVPVVVFGVPGAFVDCDVVARGVLFEVFVDEGGLDFNGAAAAVVEEGAVEGVPEVGFGGVVAEPAAVVAIAGGGDEGLEVAVLGALLQFVDEPEGVHAGELGVGEVAVADDDGDFVVAVTAEVRAVAAFLPAHVGVFGLDVDVVYHDVLEAVALEHGDHFHAEAHFGWPEAVEAGAPEEVLGDVFPAGDLGIPIGGRDEGEDAVVVGGAEDVEDVGVLQVPEEVAELDDAEYALLKAGAGECFEERAGEVEVDAGDVFILPECAWHAVHGEEDFLGFPGAFFEEAVEVGGGLVVVEDERVVDHEGEVFCNGSWLNKVAREFQ